ncbi:hypothetical protein [Leifsonia kafniensis]
MVKFVHHNAAQRLRSLRPRWPIRIRIRTRNRNRNRNRNRGLESDLAGRISHAKLAVRVPKERAKTRPSVLGLSSPHPLG